MVLEELIRSMDIPTIEASAWNRTLASAILHALGKHPEWWASPAKKRSPRSATQKERAIIGACKSGLKGHKYCQYLDQKKVSPRPMWQKDPLWPGNYARAYKSPDYREPIQDEKCKIYAKSLLSQRCEYHSV